MEDKIIENENKVTYYLIPANVSTRFELFQGFGWNELKLVIIALLIGVFIFFNTGFITKTIEIDPKNISIEQRIGANPDDFKLNKNGMIEKKVNVIPTPIRVFFIIIPCIGTYFFVKKDPNNNNMSLMDILKSSKEFNRRQKLYLYKYDSGMED